MARLSVLLKLQRELDTCVPEHALPNTILEAAVVAAGAWLVLTGRAVGRIFISHVVDTTVDFEAIVETITSLHI